MRILFMIAAVATLVAAQHTFAQEADAKKAEVSFKADVMPLVKRTCMPCHAEEEFNPSEFSMDSYDLIAKGGKHGTAVVAGKSQESTLVQKLREKPPFGERMPLNSKKKVAAGTAKWLTPEEIRVFADWVDQGAKNN